MTYSDIIRLETILERLENDNGDLTDALIEAIKILIQAHLSDNKYSHYEY